jgi:glycosyltransferase involved in cell wall biosynthesis
MNADNPISSVPAVSVICAAYNGAAWLPETIESLRRQRMRDFEAIIVDDASTDATPQVLAAIGDPRFVVLTNERNSYLTFTRNRAASVARGSYIAVTDQDDLSQPERLLHQAEYLDSRPKASAVYALVQGIDASGRPTRGAVDWAYGGQQARAALMFHNFVTHSALMFRRSCIAGAPYASDYPLCEDYRLISHLADSGDGIFPLRQRLVKYRFHGSNHTTEAFDRMQKYSRLLRRDLLTRIGLSPTESEMDLHAAFESPPGTPSLRALGACRDWLMHLREANRVSDYVPCRDFDAIVADKWLDVAHKHSALGRETWRCYQAGPHAALESRHWPSVASLWVKTTLRHARVGAAT